MTSISHSTCILLHEYCKLSSNTVVYNVVLCFYTASQMWCLAVHLPFLVGDQVPEDSELWQLFIKLLNIVAVCFSPVVSQDQLAYLQVLIEEHHKEFCRLYPDCSVIPKMHYMVHMPRVMLRYWVLPRAQHCYTNMHSASLYVFCRV